MEIEWKEEDTGFFVGRKGGVVVCKISKHWSGCWLDGFEYPIRCKSVDDAKLTAEKQVLILES